MSNEISNEEIKAIKNEYFRAWRRNNRDKIRKAQNKYWEKKAKTIKQNSQI